MIPSFLLAKLYIKGSLKNTGSGFEFELKNIIDSTTLTGIGPITVGGISYEGERVSLAVADRVVTGAELSHSNPLPVRMGETMRVAILGAKLSQEMQKITLTATTSDIGKIKFDISDTAA